jgi:hypothetical protein
MASLGEDDCGLWSSGGENVYKLVVNI